MLLHVLDSTGKPVPVTEAMLGGGGGAGTTDITDIGGTDVNPTIAAAGAMPVQQLVGSAAVSSSNPLPITGAVQPLVTTSDWTLTGDVQNGALTDTIKTAPGASLYNTLNWLTLSAGTLGAAATVSIKDGAAGTVKWQQRIQTTGISQHFQFNPPIAASANTLLEIATTDPTSGLIYWAAGGTVVA